MGLAKVLSTSGAPNTVRTVNSVQPTSSAILVKLRLTVCLPIQLDKTFRLRLLSINLRQCFVKYFDASAALKSMAIYRDLPAHHERVNCEPFDL